MWRGSSEVGEAGEPSGAGAEAGGSHTQGAGAGAVTAATVAALGQQMKLLAQGESLFAAFGDIPDPRLCCPQSRAEWEIQTFNVTMQIPNRFGTVDQVGDWIKDCAHLNREAVGKCLTTVGHEPVLEYLSFLLGNLNAKLSLVDNLKIFFAVTGAVEIEGLESGDARLRTLLEHFAKGFCAHSAAELQARLVADIGAALLLLSRGMRSGQPAASLQNFFVDIRALNASQDVLSSRVISDIYNDFISIGPFKRIKGRKSPEYFLMNPLRSEWVTVYFGFDDNEPKEAWVVVTKSVLYLFVGEEKRPYGCVPLQFVRVSLGRLLLWTVELHSCRGAGVPFVRYDSDEYYNQTIGFGDIACIPFISLRIPDQATDILHSWFDLIESCCWSCRQE
jgi:hypothetical protein